VEKKKVLPGIKTNRSKESKGVWEKKGSYTTKHRRWRENPRERSKSGRGYEFQKRIDGKRPENGRKKGKKREALKGGLSGCRGGEKQKKGGPPIANSIDQEEFCRGPILKKETWRPCLGQQKKKGEYGKKILYKEGATVWGGKKHVQPSQGKRKLKGRGGEETLSLNKEE